MQRFGPISRGIAIATLLCFAAPQAEAIELFGSGTVAERLDDGSIVQVRAGRGGVRHGGGMHRGGESRRLQSRRLRPPGTRPRRQSLRPSQLQPKRESQHQPECEPQRLSQRSPRRLLGRLGAAGWVLVAGRRRGRSRRGDGLHQRRRCSLVGGRGSRSEPLLVLYRPEPPAGLLGRLPVNPPRSSQGSASWG